MIYQINAISSKNLYFLLLSCNLNLIRVGIVSRHLSAAIFTDNLI